MEDLEEKLDGFLEENPGRFRNAVARRVRRFIRDSEGGGKKPFHLFGALDDWILYHRLHDGWQGMSPRDINENPGNGAKQFYNALLYWCRLKVPGDSREVKRKRNVIRRRVLDYVKPSYDHLDTLEKLAGAKEDNPVWRDATSRQMQRNEVEGGNAFYRHCREFVKGVARSRKEEKEMMAVIFRPQHTSYGYSTIRAWKEAYEREFYGHTVSSLERDGVPGGRRYLTGLRGWLRQRYPDSPGKRADVMRKIFVSYSPYNRKGR